MTIVEWATAGLNLANEKGKTVDDLIVFLKNAEGVSCFFDTEGEESMMGIYIKGMEMPKVPTRFIIFADGRVEDEDDSAYKYSALPVPPHGDLIDSGTYRDEFMSGVYDLCNDDPDNNRANAIIDLFDSAPVIIPANIEERARP